jgi:hypothetical protein
MTCSGNLRVPWYLSPLQLVCVDQVLLWRQGSGIPLDTVEFETLLVCDLCLLLRRSVAVQERPCHCLCVQTAESQILLRLLISETTKVCHSDALRQPMPENLEQNREAYCRALMGNECQGTGLSPQDCFWSP